MEADAIYEMTMAEIKKGYSSELMPAIEVNRRFGVGGWRPLHRFLILQADGKRRLIDDGKRGEQNCWASLQETIFTVGIDFIPAVAAAVANRMAGAEGAEVDLEWADLMMATTDLPDAFRGWHRRTKEQQ